MRYALFRGDFTQRRLIVSRQNFGTVGGGEIVIAVLVTIQVIWDVSPCRLVNLPASSGPTALDEGITFHRNVRHQSTGCNLHQHLCGNVMSHRLGYRAGKGRTENRWVVSGAGQSATPEVYISTVSTSRSQQLTVRATTDVFLVTAECCSISDISI